MSTSRRRPDGRAHPRHGALAARARLGFTGFVVTDDAVLATRCDGIVELVDDREERHAT
jgi:hypothetical protein